MKTHDFRIDMAILCIGVIVTIIWCVLLFLDSKESIETYDETRIISYNDIIEFKEDSSYNTPIEVESDPVKYVVYGNLTYIKREDGYLERNGSLWRPIRVTTTAYTWKDDGVNPSIGAGDGKTSIGKDAIRTYGYAADPDAIPYGTTIHVAGYGVFEVDDTGGAMRTAWRSRNEIILDLRIPQLKFNGSWRSVRQAQRVAMNHGRQINRIVLVQIE